MSCNSAFAGYQIYLTDEWEEAKDIYTKLGFIDKDETEDDMWDEYWDRKERLNEWIPYSDIDGNYGIIYLIHYEYESYDLVVYEKLDKPTLPNVLSRKYKYYPLFFAIQWYNGTDNPFKFQTNI